MCCVRVEYYRYIKLLMAVVQRIAYLVPNVLGALLGASQALHQLREVVHVARVAVDDARRQQHVHEVLVLARVQVLHLVHATRRIPIYSKSNYVLFNSKQLIHVLVVVVVVVTYKLRHLCTSTLSTDEQRSTETRAGWPRDKCVAVEKIKSWRRSGF